MADDVHIVVIVYQTVGSFRKLLVTFVRPPLGHVAQLVKQPAGVVVIV